MWQTTLPLLVSFWFVCATSLLVDLLPTRVKMKEKKLREAVASPGSCTAHLGPCLVIRQTSLSPCCLPFRSQTLVHGPSALLNTSFVWPRLQNSGPCVDYPFVDRLMKLSLTVKMQRSFVRWLCRDKVIREERRPVFNVLIDMCQQRSI